MPDAELIEGVAPGPAWDAVFAEGPGLQSSREWFAAIADAACPAGTRPAMLQLKEGGVSVGLLPLLLGPGRAAGSLTSPYTVLFQPLVEPRHARALGQAMARSLRGCGTVTLDALDPAWPGLDPLLAGLRRGGLWPIRFDQFGNWQEDVAGLDWTAYLARRPRTLQETIRRKGKVADRQGNIRFQVITVAEDLPAGLAAYETVYASSWKNTEPFPGFTAALLTRLAPSGRMRLGLVWQGEKPIAAQYWTVDAGVATVLKLAHDEAAKPLSPGTLLTAHMIRLLLADGVHTLDFGRGDDPYKGQWTTVRRQRIGVLLANPLRPAGLAALARHGLGRLAHRLRR